jgi:hypothetical protein
MNLSSWNRAPSVGFGCASLLGLFATLLSGCTSDASGSGTLSVLLEPESTITDGLDPGQEVDNIQDGWQVRWDKYIAVIGDIDVHLATDDQIQDHDEDFFAVDLLELPNQGRPLWEIEGLPEGRFEFFYSLGGGAHGAIQHESVSDKDFETIVDEDATYLIAGTLSREDGISCPPEALASIDSATESGKNDAGVPCFENPAITFSLAVTAETLFGPCSQDGVPGFSVTDGQTTDVAVTFHGDHLFFNGFPTSDEGGIIRLAQWLADSDLNVDGTVTKDELESISVGALSEFADYQFTSSPIQIETAWDYVVAQLKTQGHMNGEGECPIDGAEHDHGD